MADLYPKIHLDDQDLFTLADARALLGSRVVATAQLGAGGLESPRSRYVQPGDRGTVCEAYQWAGSDRWELKIAWDRGRETQYSGVVPRITKCPARSIRSGAIVQPSEGDDDAT